MKSQREKQVLILSNDLVYKKPFPQSSNDLLVLEYTTNDFILTSITHFLLKDKLITVVNEELISNDFTPMIVDDETDELNDEIERKVCANPRKSIDFQHYQSEDDKTCDLTIKLEIVGCLISLLYPIHKPAVCRDLYFTQTLPTLFVKLETSLKFCYNTFNWSKELIKRISMEIERTGISLMKNNSFQLIHSSELCNIDGITISSRDLYNANPVTQQRLRLMDLCLTSYYLDVNYEPMLLNIEKITKYYKKCENSSNISLFQSTKHINCYYKTRKWFEKIVNEVKTYNSSKHNKSDISNKKSTTNNSYNAFMDRIHPLINEIILNIPTKKSNIINEAYGCEMLCSNQYEFVNGIACEWNNEDEKTSSKVSQSFIL